MLSVTGILCFAALIAADAFIAPLAGRYHPPLESTVVKASPRMSTGGGDEPLVFRRFAI